MSNDLLLPHEVIRQGFSLVTAFCVKIFGESSHLWPQTRLILGLRPANERRHYFVMTSLIDWVQA